MAESEKRLHFYAIWRAMGIGLIAAVLALSLLPMPVDANLPENGDKLGHLLMYGSLMFWFGLLYPAWRRRFALALAFCAMGIGVEFLQDLTPYRSFEQADMVANSVGVLIGWCIVLTPLQHALVWFEGLILPNGDH